MLVLAALAMVVMMVRAMVVEAISTLGQVSVASGIGMPAAGLYQEI